MMKHGVGLARQHQQRLGVTDDVEVDAGAVLGCGVDHDVRLCMSPARTGTSVAMTNAHPGISNYY